MHWYIFSAQQIYGHKSYHKIPCQNSLFGATCTGGISIIPSMMPKAKSLCGQRFLRTVDWIIRGKSMTQITSHPLRKYQRRPLLCVAKLLTSGCCWRKSKRLRGWSALILIEAPSRQAHDEKSTFKCPRGTESIVSINYTVVSFKITILILFPWQQNRNGNQISFVKIFKTIFIQPTKSKICIPRCEPLSQTL